MKSTGNTFSRKAIDFFINLKTPGTLPAAISILNPYNDKEVKKIIENFYGRFFNDTNERILILGINPGRFGGGVTGIPFTDPIRLEEHCGIKNNFIKRPELSSKFIYSVINAFGGAKRFFSHFFISALFPLALINNGKNYNYYDSNELYEYLKPGLITSLKIQANFGIRKDTVICLGKKNFKFLNILNSELNYFENIIVLEHPRYIMQYRLKEKNLYIKKYLGIFESLLT